jgi:thioredoxin 1
MMIFKNGQVSATKVGAMPKSKIVEWINESVSGGSDIQSGAR